MIPIMVLVAETMTVFSSNSSRLTCPTWCRLNCLCRRICWARRTLPSGALESPLELLSMPNLWNILIPKCNEGSYRSKEMKGHTKWTQYGLCSTDQFEDRRSQRSMTASSAASQPLTDDYIFNQVSLKYGKGKTSISSECP